MNNKLRLHVVALVFLSTLGGLLFYSPPASAAAAICYQQSESGDSFGDGGIATGVVPCSSFPPAAVRALPAGRIRPDHCYVGGLSIIEHPMPGPQCSRLRQLAGATAEGPDERPGGSRNTSAADPLDAEDIFGTSREELQSCDGADCVNNNPITKLAIYAINILGALVGVIAVAMIVLAGIQYSSSGGNPQVTAEAKKRIINVMIALASFIFLWAFMQWVIPGGALN